MLKNESYLIVVTVSLPLRGSRLVTPYRCLVVTGLEAVAAFKANFDLGEEWTVFRWDGSKTRELTDLEFREWERLSNLTKTA